MKLVYVNHNNRQLNLTSWPIMAQNVESVLNHNWKYSIAGNEKKAAIISFYKQVEERELKLAIFADSKEDFGSLMNDIHRTIEEDIDDMQPGRLVIGSYYLPCYILAQNYEEYEEDYDTTDVNLTVIAERMVWIKETRKEYIWTENIDTEGRGYAYGYDYDYTMGSGNVAKIRNTHFASCNFVLKISGYAKNPMVTIGDHVYRVMETVQKNEILTIDTRNKTIVLTKNNGVQVNCYSKRDKSSYIFEPIPAGEQRLYWNAAFNLEITLYEERSEPLWM